MRKLLILCSFALSAIALTAQTTPRNSTKAAPASRNPTTAPASRTSSRTATPTVTPRSTLQPAAANRSTGTATATETTRDVRSNTQTPKTVDSKATPKTVPSKMPEAPQLKQDEPMVKVEWLTLEEALEKSKTDKRKIFIDVYTDWCGWCKRMDQATFVDPDVAKYLNDNYYAVKLNAEQEQDITFNNKTYHFRKNGSRGYHELAAELLNNRLSFPTVVFLDESMNVIQPIPGYLEAPKLETILNYFGTDSHKTTPWETYERNFNGNNQK